MCSNASQPPFASHRRYASWTGPSSAKIPESLGLALAELNRGTTLPRSARCSSFNLNIMPHDRVRRDEAEDSMLAPAFEKEQRGLQRYIFASKINNAAAGGWNDNNQTSTKTTKIATKSTSTTITTTVTILASEES
eukprot:GEZU01003455.1.p1 GENE.GEZU01003455.1~~GEZU01003455.1.p1  ORF type:complete len:136 (-),score=28.40 GEZU01003455.1:174-581(-)